MGPHSNKHSTYLNRPHHSKKTTRWNTPRPEEQAHARIEKASIQKAGDIQPSDCSHERSTTRENGTNTKQGQATPPIVATTYQFWASFRLHASALQEDIKRRIPSDQLIWFCCIICSTSLNSGQIHNIFGFPSLLFHNDRGWDLEIFALH